ncbi:LptF/LptG family permease [Candidatus Pelagibacter sp.]|nr:LptF/LptG family permease [Candidatus Pelagibacter sp.]
MKIEIHKLYLLKKFLKKIFLVSSIFFALVLIINLIEEINFLKEIDSKFFLPVWLTLLNAPSLLYEIFPFIILISTQIFFIDIIENKELFILKNLGLNNLNILKFILFITFIFSLCLIIIFYNFSSILKHQYLLIKNGFSTDNKYLAVITENGLWIRDVYNNKTVIINADKISGQLLLNASITEFDNNYKIQKNLISKKIDVLKKNWVLYDVLISDEKNNSKKVGEMRYNSNFDLEKINNLFSDLSSLTFFELVKLKKDYKLIGYSTNDIDVQLQKIYSFPFLLSIMSVISSILMINIKYQKNILLHIFIGIMLSVLIYYIGHFSSLLGSNNKIPITLSVWFPVLILSIVSSIGIVRINEK